MNKATIYKHPRDDWGTPQWLLDALRDTWFGGEIPLDVASSQRANDLRVKATRFYDEENSALAPDVRWDEPLFMNPPFSQKKEFLGRLYTALNTGECPYAAVIVPASPGTQWFHEFVNQMVVVLLPDRRINYMKWDEEKGEEVLVKGAPFPSAIGLAQTSIEKLTSSQRVAFGYHYLPLRKKELTDRLRQRNATNVVEVRRSR